MDYAIYVSGDAQFTSKIKSLKQIHLILSNEHYTLDKSKFQRRKHCSKEDKKILMYEYEDGEIKCFDGEDEFYITKDNFDDIYSNPITSNYILARKNFINSVKQLNLNDSYHSYLEIADKVKEETNGYINFYKCASIKDVALNVVT